MAKGEKTGGRKAGTPNKATTLVKDNILAVFNRLGGTSARADWARENQTEFYRLYGRLLPLEVSGTLAHSGEIEHVHRTAESLPLNDIRSKASEVEQRTH